MKNLNLKIETNNQKIKEWERGWGKFRDIEKVSLKESQDFFKKGIKLLDKKMELHKPMIEVMKTQREKKLRKQLKNVGLMLKKSKAKNITANDFCDYMILDAANNAVVAGSNFELSLEDVEDFLYD